MHQEFIAPANKEIKLASFDPNFTGNYKNKEDALADLEKNKARLSDLQSVLYAQKTQSLLIVVQALDAAGKDSLIKHVFAGLDPLGVEVTGFKTPTPDEMAHDFLWRSSKALPPRGKIGIFSRSYYEEVLVVRVHPEILEAAPLPEKIKTDKNIWKHRLEDIRNYEKYLVRNGVAVIKIFIHTSKEEQKKQLLERIEDAGKHWKFAFGDLAERARWNDYMSAFEKTFAATSTPEAPWYILPGNKRWFTRALLAEITVKKLESMNLEFPVVTDKQKQEIAQARQMLENE